MKTNVHFSYLSSTALPQETGKDIQLFIEFF